MLRATLEYIKKSNATGWGVVLLRKRPTVAERICPCLVLIRTLSFIIYRSRLVFVFPGRFDWAKRVAHQPKQASNIIDFFMMKRLNVDFCYSPLSVLNFTDCRSETSSNKPVFKVIFSLPF